jgi:hypothetical protein
MGKIISLTLICIFMAFTAKNGAVLFIFLVHVPFIIGAEIYRYRQSKREFKEYLKQRRV